MGETAEERARRLRYNDCIESFSRIAQGILGWSEDDTNDYERLLTMQICREMIDEVCDEPTVTLVKEYDKGSFKFV